MKNVLVVGRTPLPYGGVSVFIQRYSEELKSKGHQVTVVDPRGVKGKVQLILELIKKHDEIIVNNFSIIFFVALFVTFNVKKTVFVDHNHSRHFKGKYKHCAWFFCWFCSRFRVLWLVNEALIDNYTHKSNIVVKSPFISPSKSCIDRDYGNVPDEIKSIIRSYKYVFVNSSSQDVDILSQDIYGFSDSVRAFSRLNISDSVLLLFHSSYSKNIKEELDFLIDETGVNGRVFYLRGDFPLWAIFPRITCFLRTTRTDGDSVSVREAISLQCPVIASDVISRPERVLLYPVNNISVLEKQMFSVIR